MEFLKGMAGKIVGGVVALLVIIGAIGWFRMDAASRAALLGGVGNVILWFAIVLVLPWAGFLLIGRVGRMDNNTAGAALVGGLTLFEGLLLLWLFDWSVTGLAAWIFVLLGMMVAGVYNLFTCDWIAEKAA